MRNEIARFLAIPLLGSCLWWSSGASAECEQGQTAGPPPLEVDGHYFQAAGEPFTWVGDTAWYGVTLSPDQMDVYLDDRRSRGFNVIQGPILIDPLVPIPIVAGDALALRPDAEGNLPFWSISPLIPNEAYWQNVDCFVNKATDRGFYLALPLIWGHTLDGLFTTDAQRRDYARFAVRRYADYPNVVWVLAGEWQKIAWRNEARDRTTPTRAEIAMIDELAAEVLASKGPDQLVTIHPDGYTSSSDAWQQRGWLDFNMIQSFDSQRQNRDDVTRDWRRSPVKPTLQAEVCYEDATTCGEGAWQPRMSAYISAFSGSAGYTYGHADVWSFGLHGNADWLAGLDAPGARDSAGPFRRLMEAYHTARRVPDQSVVVGGEGSVDNDTYTAVTRDRDGRYLLAYSSDGGSFQLDTRVLAATTIRARWFDPRNGRFQWIGFLDRSARQLFDPPGRPGPGNDAVLVLDQPTG